MQASNLIISLPASTHISTHLVINMQAHITQTELKLHVCNMRNIEIMRLSNIASSWDMRFPYIHNIIEQNVLKNKCACMLHSPNNGPCLPEWHMIMASGRTTLNRSYINTSDGAPLVSIVRYPGRRTDHKLQTGCLEQPRGRSDEGAGGNRPTGPWGAPQGVDTTE